jgi:hypothetical protein
MEHQKMQRVSAAWLREQAELPACYPRDWSKVARDADGLAKVKPPVPIFDGLINKPEVIAVTAESFTGKSALAMEVGRALVSGQPLFGTFPINERRPRSVLYVHADATERDYARLWRKLNWRVIEHDRKVEAAWCAIEADRYSVDPDTEELPEVSDAFVVDGITYDSRREPTSTLKDWSARLRTIPAQAAIKLDDPDDVARLAAYVLAFKYDSNPDDPAYGTVCKGFDVIVVDTQRTTMLGEENSSTEQQVYWDNIKQLSLATGATIIVLGHLNKWAGAESGVPRVSAERWRGSSGSQAAVDTHIQLHRHPKVPGLIEVFVVKGRAGLKCAGFMLTWRWDETTAEFQWLRAMSEKEAEGRNPGGTPLNDEDRAAIASHLGERAVAKVKRGRKKPEEIIHGLFNLSDEVSVAQMETTIKHTEGYTDLKPRSLRGARAEGIQVLVERKQIVEGDANAPGQRKTYRRTESYCEQGWLSDTERLGASCGITDAFRELHDTAG